MMQKLMVSENKRFLMLQDHTPFFWLADTAWELLRKLTVQQTEDYFKKRAKQGFNVIQTVILSEFDGLTIPNADGRVPLCKDESGVFRPDKPDISGENNYFDHIDKVLALAEKYDLYVALVPSWGDKWNLKWGKGPEIFNPDNAFAYGKFLGQRYKNADNVIWILGGDRPVETDAQLQIVRRMAEGIKAGGAEQLMTFHPMGGTSSSDFVQNEDWLDFNMIQSGHSDAITNTDQMIAADYRKTPVRPVVEGECNYEDHPIGFDPVNGFFDDTDVRRASYYAVFTGSFGVTYGHHCVWPMLKNREDMRYFDFLQKPNYFLMTTFQALERPGANQMQYLKRLMESKSFFDRVPANDLLAENFGGAQRQVATKGENYILVYCPFGIPCRLKPLARPFSAQWMDPRTGDYLPAKAEQLTDGVQFTPPAAGRNEDFVLVIDFR